MSTYLFILCPPYSGSTLLWRLLCTSDNVSALATEGQFVPEVAGEMRAAPWDADQELDWPKIKRVWDGMWDHGKPILVEKSPPNLLRVQALSEYFEPTRFVLMVRDPYAHCEGLMRRNHWHASEAARFAVRCLRLQAENAGNLPDSVRFTYEELTSMPEVVSSRIVEAIPEIGRLRLDARFNIHSVDGVKERSIEDLNARKRLRLSLDDVAKIGKVLADNMDVMRFWGYELYKPTMSHRLHRCRSWFNARNQAST